MLDAAPQLAAYVPVDISGEMLEQRGGRTARRLSGGSRCCRWWPTFVIRSICRVRRGRRRARVGFFPGSTIGNFEPHEAAAFLRNAAHILGPKSTLIIGVDLVKDTDVLNAAYNDEAGVTAKFNLNLLTRINRELGGNFKLDTLRAPRLLQPRAPAHRDAPRQPQAAEGEGAGENYRLPRR